MATLIAIIICLGVWFFMIAPFIRLYRMSKPWRDVYADARNQQKEAQRQASRQQQSPRKSKKKKIDPNVGEYVEFTETTEVYTETTSTDRDDIKVKVESQITDVTWTDLPPEEEK